MIILMEKVSILIQMEINDYFCGKGTFYFTDGEKYVGDWKKDIKDGFGVYYYKSGNRYEGEFKKDHGEGKGVFYYANGDRHEGQFHNGKPFGNRTVKNWVLIMK